MGKGDVKKGRGEGTSKTKVHSVSIYRYLAYRNIKFLLGIEQDVDVSKRRNCPV